MTRCRPRERGPIAGPTSVDRRCRRGRGRWARPTLVSKAMPPACGRRRPARSLREVCTGRSPGKVPYPSASRTRCRPGPRTCSEPLARPTPSLGCAPMVALRGERSSRPSLDHARSPRPATPISMLRGGHMRQRSLGLTLFGGVAIIVAACGGGATPSPPASAAASPPPLRSPAPAEPGVRSRRPPSARTGAGPQDRRRHGHRHAQRQELQRVLVQGRRRQAPPPIGARRAAESIVPTAAAEYASVHPVVHRPEVRRRS